jgi:hypothetical protein
MNIEEKKRRISKSLDHIQDERIIDSIEDLLKKLRIKSLEKEITIHSTEDLENRIAESEKDFEKKLYTDARTLLNKYK